MQYKLTKHIDPEGWNRGVAQKYATEAKPYKSATRVGNGARHEQGFLVSGGFPKGSFFIAKYE